MGWGENLNNIGNYTSVESESFPLCCFLMQKLCNKPEQWWIRLSHVLYRPFYSAHTGNRSELLHTPKCPAVVCFSVRTSTQLKADRSWTEFRRAHRCFRETGASHQMY